LRATGRNGGNKRLGQNYFVKFIRGPSTCVPFKEFLFLDDPSVRGRATTLSGYGQGDIIL
jgi:hypothetical protein